MFQKVYQLLFFVVLGTSSAWTTHGFNEYDHHLLKKVKRYHPIHHTFSPVLDQLPAEMLHHIFTYLDLQSYACATRVNDHWHQCAEHCSLWKEYAQQQGIPILLYSDKQTSWKDLVKQQNPKFQRIEWREYLRSESSQNHVLEKMPLIDEFEYDQVCVNASNQTKSMIVGQASYVENGRQFRTACTYSKDQGVNLLTTYVFHDETGSSALCLNDNGSVIGGFIKTCGSENENTTHAVIWANDKLFKVIELVDQVFKKVEGVEIDEWHFKRTKFISSDGCTFEGEGTYKDIPTGWRMTIPYKYLM